MTISVPCLQVLPNLYGKTQEGIEISPSLRVARDGSFKRYQGSKNLFSITRQGGSKRKVSVAEVAV